MDYHPPKLASVIFTTWSLNRKVGHKIRKVAASYLCKAVAQRIQAVWKENTIHQRLEHQEMKIKIKIQNISMKGYTDPAKNQYVPTNVYQKCWPKILTDTSYQPGQKLNMYSRVQHVQPIFFKPQLREKQSTQCLTW